MITAILIYYITCEYTSMNVVSKNRRRLVITRDHTARHTCRLHRYLKEWTVSAAASSETHNEKRGIGNEKRKH